MTLSIVIPTHDTRELTLAAVGSVFAQGEGGAPAGLIDPVDPIDLIVVDDASEDGTAEALAERWPQARILRVSPAEGFTAAANRGLQAARGQLLLLLNSDTEIQPGALAALRRAFAERPDLGIAGAQLYYPDGSLQWSAGGAPSLLWLFVLASGAGRVLRWLRFCRRRDPGGRTEGGGVWVTGAAMAMRRSVWSDVGPFDREFRFYAQDLDFCLRAGARGARVALLPEFRVLHHHGASIRSAPGAAGLQQPALLWEDLLRWAEKHRGAPWARRAAGALKLGARLRLAALGARRLLLAGERRAACGSEIDAYRAAVGAVANFQRQDSTR